MGEAPAAALLAARMGDGLEANVPYTPGTGPGVWQPTPPKFGPALTPWLGQMRPFTMSGIRSRMVARWADASAGS